MKTKKAYNYYKDQLSILDPKNENFPTRIKLTGINNQTKWMSLNDESANELVQWLKENYNIK